MPALRLISRAPWLPLLLLLGCYPATGENPAAPGSTTPPPPPVPPAVGAVVFGSFVSGSSRPLEFASAIVGVYSPDCATNELPVQGAGYAPPYKEGTPTYRAQLVTHQSAFDACVRFSITYAYSDDLHLLRYDTSMPVTFTAQGATVAALPYHMDIVLP